MASYIFFGHGWNTSETFSIENLNNVGIGMISSATCLYEDSSQKHMQMMLKYQNSSDYLEALKNYAAQYKNEFCIYRSSGKQEEKEKNVIVPDLLLTTLAKGQESNKMIKFGSIRAEKMPVILMLSDIVKILYQKHPEGFFLLVYACRTPLDSFQVKNMGAFGEIKSGKILEFVKDKNLRILEDDEIVETPKCSPW